MKNWIFIAIVLSVSGAATAAPVAPVLYVATTSTDGGGRLYEVDSFDGAVLGLVDLPGAPWALAVDASNERVYISVCQLNQVLVIDLGPLRLVDAIDVGNCPAGLAVDPSKSNLYVVNGKEDFVPSISVVDTAHRVEIDKLPTLLHPHSLVLGAAGRLYVASDGGGIDVIDTFSGQRLRDELPSSRGDAFTTLAMNSDGRTLFVGDSGANAIQMVDLAERQTVAIVHLPDNPNSIALTRDDRLLLAAVGGQPGSVLVVNPRNLAIDWSIETPGNPVAVGVGEGSDAYIVSDTGGSATVSKLDLETLTAISIVSVNGTPSTFGNAFIAIPAVSARVQFEETTIGASRSGCTIRPKASSFPIIIMSLTSILLVILRQVDRRHRSERD